jgi:type IV pilus assembly protein PilY1
VYGGDLQGNLWKFDISGSSAAAWNVAFGGTPLFTARTAGGEIQSITGGIRVSAGPGAGVMVYFGTGRYFVDGDNDVPANPDIQSLYGIYDNGEDAVTNGRAGLQRQWIQEEVVVGGVRTRNISRNMVSYYGVGAARGWYMDLVVDNASEDETVKRLRPLTGGPIRLIKEHLAEGGSALPRSPR